MNSASTLERAACAWAACRARLRSEAGTMTVLTLGVLVVILMVIGLGVAITGVHLARNELQSMADGASLAASQGFQETSIYDGPDSGPLLPTPQSARTLAEEYLERYPPRTDRLRDVTIREVDVRPDGSVRIVLDGACDPPLIGWFTSSATGGIPLSAAGDALAR